MQWKLKHLSDWFVLGLISSVWMSKSRKTLSVACKTKKTGNWHASRGVQPVMVLGQLHQSLWSVTASGQLAHRCVLVAATQTTEHTIYYISKFQIHRRPGGCVAVTSHLVLTPGQPKPQPHPHFTMKPLIVYKLLDMASHLSVMAVPVRVCSTLITVTIKLYGVSYHKAPSKCHASVILVHQFEA